MMTDVAKRRGSWRRREAAAVIQQLLVHVDGLLYRVTSATTGERGQRPPGIALDSDAMADLKTTSRWGARSHAERRDRSIEKRQHQGREEEWRRWRRQPKSCGGTWEAEAGAAACVEVSCGNWLCAWVIFAFGHDHS